MTNPNPLGYAADEAVAALHDAADALEDFSAETEIGTMEVAAIDVAVTRFIAAHQRYRRSLAWSAEVGPADVPQ